MKASLLGMALATAVGSVAGCAHEMSQVGTAQELHGAVQVASSIRMVLAGPASDVRASFDENKPVWLFVVGAVTGDDRDCALDTVRETPVVVEVDHPLQLAKGRELCVAVAGSTEVFWEARVETYARPRPIPVAAVAAARTVTVR